MFRNKLDKDGNITKNKVRLVAKGYNQEEGIDYDKTIAPVTRLKAIKILLAFASYMNFKTFLNGCEKCLFKWFYWWGGACDTLILYRCF